MKLKLSDGTLISCGNSDALKCQYQQVPSENMPVVDSVALTDSATITFTG